jgi:hypothetical protein
MDGHPDVSDLGWTGSLAGRFAALEAGVLTPERLRNFEKMQRELEFLAKRQYWTKMKKHQPRPSGSDSDTDE